MQPIFLRASFQCLCTQSSIGIPVLHLYYLSVHRQLIHANFIIDICVLRDWYMCASWLIYVCFVIDICEFRHQYTYASSSISMCFTTEKTLGSHFYSDLLIMSSTSLNIHGDDAPPFHYNPCGTEFNWSQRKIHFHFLSFLNTETAHVVEILPRRR